ncbi:conserved hypothetical protein, DUF1458; putative exported protein [Cupriavidus taiwanensis LMG 19424]|uniref:Dodecin n=6 Tax=Cupriavidus TaxID=106589 RepID=B2AHY6_CUPTR|nr:conserved hypothetical protein, DUF1458; putative exported protein [Cupriavidus taiwanensis LMG 19424]
MHGVPAAALGLSAAGAYDGGNPCGGGRQGEAMTNHTYKLVEIVGSSPDGCDQAIQSAIAKAGETIKNIDWFEVVETRGHIQNGKIAHYQVTLKVGFRVT